MEQIRAGVRSADSTRKSPESLDGEFLDRAHEAALKALREHALSMDDSAFKNMYGKDAVAFDKARVKERKGEFETDMTPSQIEAKKLADIFEAVVVVECAEDGWLGDDTTVRKTADYDDMFRHTDIVAELTSPTGSRELLGLAVDVTFGARSLDKKFERLREEILKGKMQQLKYVRGGNEGVPRVVVGLSKENVLQLARLWMDGDVEALREHPAQRAILEEIAAQMRVLGDFARKNGQNRVANAYERSRGTIRNILMQKKDVSMGELASDPVLRAISERLTNFA